MAKPASKPGKGTTKRKAKPATSSKQDTPEAARDRIIDAAMTCIARDGWRNLALADVAAEANVRLADVLIPFPTKHALVNAFQDRIDGEMLKAADDHAASGDAGGDARDRLFDLLMERLDALTPYRAAMAEIAKDAIRDPASVCFLPRMARTMTRVLEAAGVRAPGPFGVLQAKGLALIYADAFRVWLTDESADLSKTMAALDSGLRRAERAVRFVCRRNQRRHGQGSPDSPPSSA